MADLFEKWWMNMEEPGCGIYYRNQWYSTEASLNALDYWVVYIRQIYLGPESITCKYQRSWYLKDGEYLTYSQLHLQGYSSYQSEYCFYIRVSDSQFFQGYYNGTDGYFVEGKWYAQESSLTDAGYVHAPAFEVMYSISEYIRYRALKREGQEGDVYYIGSQQGWFQESDMEGLGLSFLPTVKSGWNLYPQNLWGGDNAGHGSHGTSHNVAYPVSTTKAALDSLFGEQPNNTEYNCIAAYVGYERKWAVGIPAYVEHYYYASLPPTEYCVVVFYHNYPSSNPMYGTWYMKAQDVAVCMEHSASVVKVYSDINRAYNAFSYPFRGTLYYFVLDNIQARWVSDLASIGYALEPTEKVSSLRYKWGEEVTVPTGYAVFDVRSSRAYATIYKASLDDPSSPSIMRFSYGGYNQYTREVQPYFFTYNGDSRYPHIRLFQGYSFQSSTSQLYGVALSYGYGIASSYPATSAICNDMVDGSTIFVSVTLGYNSTVYSNAISCKIARFERYDDYLNPKEMTPYAFKLPSTYWSYSPSSSTFQWRGNATSSSSLPFYYKNDLGTDFANDMYMGIYIRTTRTDNIRQEREIVNILTGEIQPIDYYPLDGYFYNGSFLSEAELLSIGYHAINYTEEAKVKINGESSVYYNTYIFSTVRGYSEGAYRYYPITDEDGRAFIYSNQCSIVLKDVEFPRARRLYQMPKNDPNYSPDGAMSLHTPCLQEASPYVPLFRKSGYQLYFFAGYNGSSNSATVTFSGTHTLLIDPWTFPLVGPSARYVRRNSDSQVFAAYALNSGYLIPGIGTYSSQELQNAGYTMLARSKTKRLYYSTQSFLLQGGKTKYTEPSDFTLNSSTYVRDLYEDENLTVPFVYDGSYVLVNISQSTIASNAASKVAEFSQFPVYTTSTTSARTDGFFIITERGNPKDPFKDAVLGETLKLCTCSSYKDSLTWSTLPQITVTIFYDA